LAANQWLFQRFSISAAFSISFWAFAGLISRYSGDQGASLCPLPLLLMVFLPSGRFRVYIWSGISAGWLPASSLRDRAALIALLPFCARCAALITSTKWGWPDDPLFPSGLLCWLQPCAGFYVNQIKAAPSLASASAFAAPFLLTTTGAAASGFLALVAIAEKRRF
jgi:hypothetical protein